MIISRDTLERAFVKASERYDPLNHAGMTARRFCVWASRIIIKMEKRFQEEGESFILGMNETDEFLYFIAKKLAEQVDNKDIIPKNITTPTERYFYRVGLVGVYPNENKFSINSDALLRNVRDYCPDWYISQTTYDHLQNALRLLEEVI